MNEQKKKKFIEAFKDLAKDCDLELYKHETLVNTEKNELTFKMTFKEYKSRDTPLAFQWGRMFEDVFYKLYQENRLDM